MDENKAPFWLVIKESDLPALHPTELSASSYAYELAKENPGIKYYVLIPVSKTFKKDVTVVRFLENDELPF